MDDRAKRRALIEAACPLAGDRIHLFIEDALPDVREEIIDALWEAAVASCVAWPPVKVERFIVLGQGSKYPPTAPLMNAAYQLHMVVFDPLRSHAAGPERGRSSCSADTLEARFVLRQVHRANSAVHLELWEMPARFLEDCIVEVFGTRRFHYNPAITCLSATLQRGGLL